MPKRSTFYARLLSSCGRWWSSQNSHAADLFRGASVAGILKALSAILAFGLSVVLGRMLGADAAGVYFLAFTTATIAATVGRVGLDSAVIRFIATHASANEWADAGKVYRTTLTIGLVCSVAVAVLLYLFADSLSVVVFSDPSVTTPIRVMALAIVPLSLGVLISQALLGLTRVRDSILVFNILPMGLALAGTWILATRWGVNGAAVAYLVAVFAAMVYGWRVCRLTLARRTSKQFAAPDWPLTKKLLRSGAPLLTGAILQLVLQMSGTLMLGIWADNVDVSRYTVAWRTSILISFVLLAVNTIAQPKFAELYARGEMKTLAETAHKATLLMTAFAAPIFFVFLVAPETVMSAFGAEFSSAGTTLQILSTGQFVNAIAGSVGVLLVMSSHEREYRNVQVIAACIVLVLNFILIPRFGAIGAAYAAATALIVQNVMFGYFVWTKLGILMINPRSVIQRSADDV